MDVHPPTMIHCVFSHPANLVNIFEFGDSETHCCELIARLKFILASEKQEKRDKINVWKRAQSERTFYSFSGKVK